MYRFLPRGIGDLLLLDMKACLENAPSVFLRTTGTTGKYGLTGLRRWGLQARRQGDIELNKHLVRPKLSIREKRKIDTHTPTSHFADTRVRLHDPIL